jgi:N utilization substance protein A
MKSDFLIALTQLAAERNLPREIVLSAIEAALVSAYKKDSVAAGQNISVKLDPNTGEVTVYVLKTVVNEVTDPQLEINLEAARKIKPDAKVEDVVATDSMPHSAGRIAAQTAKQVVMQRLREAERELVYQEFADKEGEVFSVNIQKVEPKQITVDLGRAEAILPSSEQIPSERYRQGQKLKMLLKAVKRTSKGPELIMSRADKLLLKRLFEMEVPEIYNGAVEIMAIAREPGSRSKVAVRARQDGVDPVGSCVGLRGVRIQNVVNELQGEKIDVVEWNKDPASFIANALSPSQVIRVLLDTQSQAAVAVVPERQLSLAIGKEGQNARLAAKLTGWKVDIKSNVEAETAGLIKPRQEPRKDAVPVPAAVRVPEAVEAVSQPDRAVEAEAPVTVPERPAAELTPTGVEAPGVKDIIAVPQVPEAAAGIPESPPMQPAPVVPEPTPYVTEPVFEEDLEEETPVEPAPVVVGGRPLTLRDLSEDIWAIPRAGASEPGRIRFAEDIAGLRGGVTARRGRQGDDQQQKGRKRRPKGGGRQRGDDVEDR